MVDISLQLAYVYSLPTVDMLCSVYLPWQRQVADAAEAKKAAVETEGKIAELMAESAAALASAHAEQGEKTIEQVTAQMGMDKEQEEDQVLSSVLILLSVYAFFRCGTGTFSRSQSRPPRQVGAKLAAGSRMGRARPDARCAWRGRWALDSALMRRWDTFSSSC